METKNKEKRLNFLLGRGWFKSKKLEDRDIDFTALSKKEEIIMPEEEKVNSTPPTEEEQPLNGILPIKKEISTNDDLRTRRKIVSFVSGEDYEALERELWEKNIQLEEVKKRLNEIRKIIN